MLCLRCIPGGGPPAAAAHRPRSPGDPPAAPRRPPGGVPRPVPECRALGFFSGTLSHRARFCHLLQKRMNICVTHSGTSFFTNHNGALKANHTNPPTDSGVPIKERYTTWMKGPFGSPVGSAPNQTQLARFDTSVMSNSHRGSKRKCASRIHSFFLR